MSLATLSAQSNLSLLRTVIADIQSYSTLHGPALTVTFAYDPSRASFQNLPCFHPAVPALYHSMVFETFFQHLQAPLLKEGSYSSHGDLIGKLGDLSHSYYTRQRGMSQTHPASASIEPIKEAHRIGLGLQVSLWDAGYRPLSVEVLTGPRDRRDGVSSSSEGATRRGKVTNTDALLVGNHSSEPMDAPFSRSLSPAAQQALHAEASEHRKKLRKEEEEKGRGFSSWDFAQEEVLRSAPYSTLVGQIAATSINPVFFSQATTTGNERGKGKKNTKECKAFSQFAIIYPMMGDLGDAMTGTAGEGLNSSAPSKWRTDEPSTFSNAEGNSFGEGEEKESGSDSATTFTRNRRGTDEKEQTKEAISLSSSEAVDFSVPTWALLYSISEFATKLTSLCWFAIPGSSLSDDAGCIGGGRSSMDQGAAALATAGTAGSTSAFTEASKFVKEGLIPPEVCSFGRRAKNCAGRLLFPSVAFSTGEEKMGEGSERVATHVLGVVSHTLVFHEELHSGQFFEILCVSPPKFFPQFHQKPWEHQIGKGPLLRGEPCLVLELEVRQRSVLVAHGTVYFSSLK